MIDAVWDLCRAAGFTGGRVLEPGCGSGLFIGLAPDDAARRRRRSSVWSSSRSPPASPPPCTRRRRSARSVSRRVRDPDGSFDLAVGNVPFGKYTLFDPIHNHDRLTIHNYFAVKSLRLVKPGGLVAVVTSRYTLDARNPAARRRPARPRRPRRRDAAAERHPPGARRHPGRHRRVDVAPPPPRRSGPTVHLGTHQRRRRRRHDGAGQRRVHPRTVSGGSSAP